MKKRDFLLSQISSHPGLLACPLCRGELAAGGPGALACPSGHSFDVASSGYVNLLAKPVKSGYGAALFEARRRVCAAGFFNALLDGIASLVGENAGMQGANPVLLDAGCGEGSHLARVAEAMQKPVTGVGVDLSKEGVQIAAREHPGILWLVGDLARLPLAEGTCDVILNILSPSNYSEFGRVLKPGGMLLKAAPGPDYLRELREALYDDGRRKPGDGLAPERFKARFTKELEKSVRTEFTAEGEILRSLVAMTPLAWRAPKDRIDALLGKGGMKVTADFHILGGMAGPEPI